MTMAVTSILPPEVVGVEALSSLIQDRLNKCKHYFLVGDKDQGKSALSCAILQEHHDHTKRPCFMYQPPKPELLPNWVTPITDLDKLPIVGTFGLISLLRGAWKIAAMCLPLALAGLFFSHSHFDRS